MDNLTHSLAGAVLGQMGLKQKTGLGMATLIIAANIPDIDAVATLLGGVQHLAIRRGITHGPIAMLLLPLMLTGIMIWFDRWQTRRGKRPVDRLPIHRGWLLALAYIGCLSHPALDWLNSYGIRLLEPFSSQWFYGDSIFIIDIWIWAALIAGLWISRRREKKGTGNWQRPAWISFVVVCAYIFANGLITGRAEAETAKALEHTIGKAPDLVVANPIPVMFWKRDMLWRMAASPDSDAPGETQYGEGSYNLFKSDKRIRTDVSVKNSMLNELIQYSRDTDKDVDAFLFWSRLPIINEDEELESEKGVSIRFGDMRFRDPIVADRFSVHFVVPWDIFMETAAERGRKEGDIVE